MTHGLVLGKFYPPHKGHIHLITEAKKNCDELTVLVCSLKRELIPGDLRFEWMLSLFPDPKIRIIWVQDENPQYPEEDPDFWNLWRKTIESHTKRKVDFLFTSEEYGEPLSKVLGCQHKVIDIHRSVVPISATKIREEPLTHWEWIPELIRPYFVKRIVLTGSESVGKTSLAMTLAKHFQTNWIPEFAREYLESKESPMDESDFLPIAKGHLLSEVEAAKSSNGILFLDTDLLTTKVYLERYYGSEIPWLTERALGLKYDTSLFLDIDIPWIRNKLRDLGEERESMRTRFLQAMNEANRNFLFIRGDYSMREQRAIEIVNQLRREPMNPEIFTLEQRRLRNFE
ncbi:ATPase [Leptospira congkakensis]|uniref:ATPase n=1 Tax=Leptospira congkakensis TaxID=2484932 RepID=A0A4Z1A4S8_9LEPT|nr:AAA family ATPase [Leptospira congkakensis]TGL88709.1 ATPase [Leptospira congkakensis]TGL89295.1 ATPase [Leptospira congkakensis]TGL97263.1 ATPase [Leptospira congkakensis]